MRRPLRALRGVLVAGAAVCALGLSAPVTLAAPPVAAPPVVTSTPSDLQATVERPTWRLHEKIVVTGRLAVNGQPLGGAPVRVAIDGNTDNTPYKMQTEATGDFRFEFWVEDWWGFGAHSLWVMYDGDGEHAASVVRTEIYVVTDRPAPVTLTVDPHPAPVRPGETVHITGTLRDDKNQPLVEHPVSLVLDESLNSRAFGSTDEQGRWSADVTVPQWSGAWSQQYPSYRVPVVFEGDWWLAPNQQELMLSLAQQPSASPSPKPSPTATRREQEPQAVATPLRPTTTPTTRVGRTGEVLPPWVTSPGSALLGGGGLLTLVGATMLSHARHRRR